MQDLLREDEFTILQHNPWRTFRVVYGIVAVLASLLALLVETGYHMVYATAYWATFFSLPVVTALLMFSFPITNMEQTRKVKLLGILGLMASFAIPFDLFLIFVNRNRLRGDDTDFFMELMFVLLIGLTVYAVQFCAAAVAVFGVAAYRKKKRRSVLN